MTPKARKVLARLSSVRTAIAIITLLAALSIIATLVPQNLDKGFYRTLYPAFLSSIVLFTGFDRFFSSPIFLILLTAFFINLSACTVTRLVSGLKKKVLMRKIGTLILHFGLVLLIAGSCISAITRRQATIFLVPGEYVTLPAGRKLVLLDFTYEKYTDGRPKAWTSVVRIDEPDGTLGAEKTVGVNHPLRLGTLSIYQSSWEERPTIRGIVLASGFEAVEDRGYSLVLAALGLSAAGLVLTSFFRLLEEHRWPS